MITRRVFVGSLTGGLLTAPLAAEAQQAGWMYRIGYPFESRPPDQTSPPSTPLCVGYAPNLYRYVSNNPLMWVDPLGLVDAISGGVVTYDFWQDPTNTKVGLGWYTTITNANGYRWQFGHIDPSTTPRVGTVIQAGQYIGEYADPTNGDSTGPHVHLQLRDPTGQLINPGPWSPIPGGCISGPWGQKRSRGPHQGVDYRKPRECTRPGPPAVGGDDLSEPASLSGRK